MEIFFGSNSTEDHTYETHFHHNYDPEESYFHSNGRAYSYVSIFLFLHIFIFYMILKFSNLNIFLIENVYILENYDI